TMALSMHATIRAKGVQKAKRLSDSHGIDYNTSPPRSFTMRQYWLVGRTFPSKQPFGMRSAHMSGGLRNIGMQSLPTFSSQSWRAL
ncbi:MAG: hypothetical protein JRN67_07720, partial [Nitrososphaerota archaeon]|nr:hypothetical protein [Nitrososphaerota archaeon]